MITPPTIDSHHSAASTTSSKRYASTFDGEDDDDEDLKPFVAKRSKGNQKNGAGGNGSGAGPKSITEKLERKEARMIRNRNAAQASRDRKKEHAQQLEARVAELEAQLEYARAGSLAATPAPRHPATTPVVTAVLQPPCAPSAYNNSISAPTTPTTSTRRRRTCSRRDRSPSIFSVSSSTPSVGAELLELEDENDTLRTQLHLEQIETARLRSRLESLEERFVLFEQQVSLGGDPSSLGSLLPTHSSNPFTAPNHEPTFTLDSSSTLLLPEPQHLVPSFPPTSSADATTPALPLMTSISSPRKRTRSSSKRTPPTLKIEEHQAPEKAEVEVEEMTKDNRPLIAVDTTILSSSSTSSQLLPSLLPSSSSSSSTSSFHHHSSSPSSSSSNSSQFGDECESLASSYSFEPLEQSRAPCSPPELDNEVWNEWAHSISVLAQGSSSCDESSGVVGGDSSIVIPVQQQQASENQEAKSEEEDPTMEFLDLSYLSDAPDAVWC